VGLKVHHKVNAQERPRILNLHRETRRRKSSSAQGHWVEKRRRLKPESRGITGDGLTEREEKGGCYTTFLFTEEEFSKTVGRVNKFTYAVQPQKSRDLSLTTREGRKLGDNGLPLIGAKGGGNQKIESVRFATGTKMGVKPEMS